MAKVVIERLPPGAYGEGCAALGSDYGRAAWDNRPEVAVIRKAVFAALDSLESRTGLGSRLRGRPILVKPNLVAVYHEMGFAKPSYPESTDPRVLDAALLWLSGRASEIIIVESSGRGAPTRGSFRVSGVDRMARHRGCGLVALDEEAVDRYILPKARVQREILVPRIFSRVVRGEAAYVSIPKLKTNLYTGVTLGFKNAMGTIPYNLRQRDHHFSIDRKLVEMLYLFRPDLILIDGVVGGEGECPAPVDPVDARMIIAGDHPVETDRVAARIMGFDPGEIALIRVADELGFGDPEGVEVVGDQSSVRFRPADASLVSERMRASFPTVKVLIGLDKDRILGPNPQGSVDPVKVVAMEASCRGGCVATTRYAFSMLEAEGLILRRELAVILGGGVEAGGGRIWYDAGGKAYDSGMIATLPGRKMVVGSCAKALASLADAFVPGCMPMPNAPHMILHELAGLPCRVMSLRNPNLLTMLLSVFGQRAARRRLLKKDERLDVPLSLDQITVEIPSLSAADSVRDWIEWPLPPLGPREAKALLAAEDDALFASLTGHFLPGLGRRLSWILGAIFTGIITLSPLAAAALSAPGLSRRLWLGIFAGIEALHVLELPFAFRTFAEASGRTGRSWSGRDKIRVALATIIAGFPVWLSRRLGVFD
jgi:uncharacterized protein (DUF362 family)